MTVPNEELVKRILPLMRDQVDSMQHEFGTLLSATRNSATNPDPQVRQGIQRRVDAKTQGLLLVYLVAMWEEYVDRDIESEWLPDGDRERLNAFRHVRHSVAHGFSGARARQCRDEFESVMNSARPFPNLKWSDDNIDLSESQVATDCQRLMSRLAQVLIGRIANDNRP